MKNEKYYVGLDMETLDRPKIKEKRFTCAFRHQPWHAYKAK